MKTSKIKSIVCQNPNQPWNDMRGNLWYFQTVSFEDGFSGSAMSKNAKPPYSVGDEVNYELKGSKDRDGVDKIKISSVDAGSSSSYSRGGGGGGRKQGSSDEIGQIVGCASNCVSRWIASGVMQKQDFEGAVKETAAIMLRVQEEMRAKIKSDKNEGFRTEQTGDSLAALAVPPPSNKPFVQKPAPKPAPTVNPVMEDDDVPF